MSSHNQFQLTTGWINVNTGCNNRCTHCYRQNDLLKKSRAINFNIAAQIIDLFSALEMYSCIFIGGEPTLYKKLPQLIILAKDKNIPEVTIVTNGRLLKDINYAKQLVEAGLDVFSISIHSAFPENHNDISGTNSWQETRAGILNAVSTKKICSLNIVVGKKNLKFIKESLPIMLSWGVGEVIISCAVPYIDNGAINGQHALNPNDFASLIEDIKEFPSNVKILHELPLCLIKKETLIKLAKENRLGYGCHVGTGKGLCFDVDGRIIPCNSFAGCPTGNIFKAKKIIYSAKEFLGFWLTNKRVGQVRDSANVYRSDICRDCRLWELCNCGCPLTWGYFDPADFINKKLLDINPNAISGWERRKMNP